MKEAVSHTNEDVWNKLVEVDKRLESFEKKARSILLHFSGLIFWLD